MRRSPAAPASKLDGPTFVPSLSLPQGGLYISAVKGQAVTQSDCSLLTSPDTLSDQRFSSNINALRLQREKATLRVSKALKTCCCRVETPGVAKECTQGVLCKWGLRVGDAVCLTAAFPDAPLFVRSLSRLMQTAAAAAGCCYGRQPKPKAFDAHVCCAAGRSNCDDREPRALQMGDEA